MGRLEPMHYVLFDGLPEADAAWFYASEFELLHEPATQHKRPDPCST